MKISLKSKRALVGGSSKGLGNAVASQLALSGATVTLLSSNEERLIKTVNDLKEKTGLNHNYLVVDYYDFQSYQQIIKKYLLIRLKIIIINN
jgi:3-oxoacyl-[acyl-carrier protein] reductase